MSSYDIHAPVLGIKKLHPEAKIPSRAHSTDAGFDLHARLDGPVKIYAGETKVIGTGIAIQLPLDHEAQIRSRSGLAAKNSIAVLNSPATIDFGYSGEIKIILINHGVGLFVVNDGDRIAQLVPAKVVQLSAVQVFELSDSDRSDHGLGSTGV